MGSDGRKASFRTGLTPAILAVLVAAFLIQPQAEAQTGGGAGKNPGPCALGGALSEAGETKEAKKAYVEALKRDPSSACAKEGLKKLNPQPEEAADQCAIGDSFQAAHRNDDATAAYKKALEKDPSNDCAADGLLETGSSWPIRTTETIVSWIPTALLVIGFVLLAWYLLLFCCKWDRLKRRVARFWVIGRPLKHTLRPRMTFTDFADGAVEGRPGAPLTARVKERLNRMREEALSKKSPEYDLDFGTPREEFADQVSESKTLQTALDSAGEVSEPTKLVAALIKILSIFLPIRRFAVSGCLEPPAKIGASLSVALEEEGCPASTTRLQGPPNEQAPTAKDYMVLADPAAVWIQYVVACSLSEEEWDATKAESQASLREGLALYNRGNLEEAKKAFEAAIVLDHTNWGAYVSLAVAEARRGGDYAKSIANILKGLEKMGVAEAREAANA